MIPTIAQTAPLTMIRIVIGRRTYAGRRLRKGVFLCRRLIGAADKWSLADHFPWEGWGGGKSMLVGIVLSTSSDGEDRRWLRGESSASSSSSKGIFRDIWAVEYSPLCRSRAMCQRVFMVGSKLGRNIVDERSSSGTRYQRRSDLENRPIKRGPPGDMEERRLCDLGLQVISHVANRCEWVIFRQFKPWNEVGGHPCIRDVMRSLVVVWLAVWTKKLNLQLCGETHPSIFPQKSQQWYEYWWTVFWNS